MSRKMLSLLMDYKSFKHLNLALKINYNFDKNTIKIRVRAFIAKIG